MSKVQQGFKEELPNKFSIALGELIRKARVDAQMSQAELAERALYRQAAISQIETGKREVSASEIVYLSLALNKPISFFYSMLPMPLEQDNLSPLEQELLTQARRLDTDDLRKLIAQSRALADLNDNDSNVS